VIDRFREGVTIAPALARGDSEAGPDLADVRVRGRLEAAVIDLLDESSAGRTSRPAARRARVSKRSPAGI
jgi:hypothetical protein